MLSEVSQTKKANYSDFSHIWDVCVCVCGDIAATVVAAVDTRKWVMKEKKILLGHWRKGRECDKMYVTIEAGRKSRRRDSNKRG